MEDGWAGGEERVYSDQRLGDGRDGCNKVSSRLQWISLSILRAHRGERRECCRVEKRIRSRPVYGSLIPFSQVSYARIGELDQLRLVQAFDFKHSDESRVVTLRRNCSGNIT